MAVLQIIADRPGAGKTSLAGALLLHLAESRKTVGYYKPLSQTPDNDPDVSFVSGSLLAGAGSPQVPSPRQIPPAIEPGSLAESPLGREIAAEAAGLRSTDLVVAEGPDLTLPGGGASPLALELASLLDSKVVLLFSYATGLDAGSVLGACQPFGDRLAGVVVNGVTEYRSRDADRVLASDLRARGVPVLGTLPEDRTMLSVTVQQIADYLGGRWAQDPENTDAYVERFLIGGNIMDLGSTYFGRYSNQAVVTRAARPDIQMASLMADTRCLVLTGGGEPTEYIRAEALQRGIPLILVEGTTLDTAEALGGLLNRATSHSIHKVQRFLHLIRANLDLDALTSAIA